MHDLLAKLAQAGPLAEAALTAVRNSESAAIANHSLRSFFFAQLLAAHEGCEQDAAYDRDLLFAATVMHDLGAGALAKGDDRFEVEGADLAAAVAREHGVPEPDVDRVWEAIALHTSPGIAARRGLLAYLTREGVGIDFGRRPGDRLGLGAADSRRLPAPRHGPVAGRGHRGASRSVPRGRAALLHRRRAAPRTPGERDHRHGTLGRVFSVGRMRRDLLPRHSSNLARSDNSRLAR